MKKYILLPENLSIVQIVKRKLIYLSLIFFSLAGNGQDTALFCDSYFHLTNYIQTHRYIIILLLMHTSRCNTNRLRKNSRRDLIP